MTEQAPTVGARQLSEPVVGAVAGVVAIIVFTIVHHITISNILFMLVPMAVLGGLSGALLAWIHTRMSGSSWWGLNGVYLAAFGLLSATSVTVFEPVTTMAEVLAVNGPPDELIGQAMPLTLVFTVATAVLVTAMFGRWRDLPAVLTTTVVLVATLGLNVSIIGLVEFQSGELGLVLFFLALIALIAVTFAVTYTLLMKLASNPSPLMSKPTIVGSASLD